MGGEKFKMINKDKTYTYEELKEIIKEAETKTIEILGKQFKEVTQKEDTQIEDNPLNQFAFDLQNLLAVAKMRQLLLEEDK